MLAATVVMQAAAAAARVLGPVLAVAPEPLLALRVSVAAIPQRGRWRVAVGGGGAGIPTGGGGGGGGYPNGGGGGGGGILGGGGGGGGGGGLSYSNAAVTFGVSSNVAS